MTLETPRADRAARLPLEEMRMRRFDFDPDGDLTAGQLAAYARFDARMREVDHALSGLRAECASLADEGLVDEDLGSVMADDLGLLGDEIGQLRQQFRADGPDDGREGSGSDVADDARTAGTGAGTAGAPAPVTPQAPTITVRERLRELRQQTQQRTGGGGPAAGAGRSATP